MRDAMRDAARRTSPEDVIARRNEEAQSEREGKEHARLERLYAERRERLDAKKRRAERGRSGDGRERREGRTGEELAGSGGPRAIPVLDVLGGRQPVFEIPPLLVGGALTMPYSDLTPCQRSAVEAALSNHESSTGAEDEGAARRRVAPLIAIVDDHTARRRAAVAVVVERVEIGEAWRRCAKEVRDPSLHRNT